MYRCGLGCLCIALTVLDAGMRGAKAPGFTVHTTQSGSGWARLQQGAESAQALIEPLS